jgi:hypothetical protein
MRGMDILFLEDYHVIPVNNHNLDLHSHYELTLLAFGLLISPGFDAYAKVSPFVVFLISSSGT